MVIKKLAHLPEKSRKVIIDFADQIAEAFTGKVEALVLFGSAAGGDFIEDKSDINILIVLDDVRAIDLNMIMHIGKKYAKKGLGIPLIFQKDHVATSLDTFPIEFSDMKRRHILLFGNDLLSNAIIEGQNLRYQCERELKSMMVNLRRGFLRTEGRKENLEDLLTGSLSTVLAACRGMMWLAEKTPPDNIDDLLAAVRTVYNADTAAIDRVWHLRKGGSESTATLETLFESYVDDIARLALIVDRL